MRICDESWNHCSGCYFPKDLNDSKHFTKSPICENLCESRNYQNCENSWIWSKSRNCNLAGNLENRQNLTNCIFVKKLLAKPPNYWGHLVSREKIRKKSDKWGFCEQIIRKFPKILGQLWISHTYLLRSTRISLTTWRSSVRSSFESLFALGSFVTTGPEVQLFRTRSKKNGAAGTSFREILAGFLFTTFPSCVSRTDRNISNHESETVTSSHSRTRVWWIKKELSEHFYFATSHEEVVPRPLLSDGQISSRIMLASWIPKEMYWEINFLRSADSGQK